MIWTNLGGGHWRATQTPEEPKGNPLAGWLPWDEYDADFYPVELNGAQMAALTFGWTQIDFEVTYPAGWTGGEYYVGSVSDYLGFNPANRMVNSGFLDFVSHRLAGAGSSPVDRPTTRKPTGEWYPYLGEVLLQVGLSSAAPGEPSLAHAWYVSLTETAPSFFVADATYHTQGVGNMTLTIAGESAATVPLYGHRFSHFLYIQKPGGEIGEVVLIETVYPIPEVTTIPIAVTVTL